MMLSLKQRLIWILLGLTLFAWVASALLTFGFVSRVMLDQVDRQLTQYSDLVNYISQVFASQIDQGQALPEPWMSGEFESTHLRPMIIDAPRGEQLNPALNIWLHDNLIAVMADSPRFAKPVEEGFDFLRVEQDDSYWRILSRYDPQTELWMRVGIELNGARWAMLGTLGRALLPLLVVLPLTLLLLYFGVSRGLQPLKILADQIARRNPGLLDPVDEAGVPAEMQGVVSSLNGLLQRLGLALESEQRFTANAAHELMTPLAAIKAEVQLCQLQLEDARGSAMLARIAERVDRASHTVEQLLTMARFDPDLPQPLPPVRLRALLLEVLAESLDERFLAAVTAEELGDLAKRSLVAAITAVTGKERYERGDMERTVQQQQQQQQQDEDVAATTSTNPTMQKPQPQPETIKTLDLQLGPEFEAWDTAFRDSHPGDWELAIETSLSTSEPIISSQDLDMEIVTELEEWDRRFADLYAS